MHMSENDKIDYAVKRICFDWPANPYWIYTSPDGGKTVYRRKHGDTTQEEIGNIYEQKAAELEVTVDYYMSEFL